MQLRHRGATSHLPHGLRLITNAYWPELYQCRDSTCAVLVFRLGPRLPGIRCLQRSFSATDHAGEPIEAIATIIERPLPPPAQATRGLPQTIAKYRRLVLLVSPVILSSYDAFRSNIQQGVPGDDRLRHVRAISAVMAANLHVFVLSRLWLPLGASIRSCALETVRYRDLA